MLPLILTALFSIGAVVVIIYIVFFSNYFRLKTIQVKNQGFVVTLSADEIRDRFVDLYGKNIFFVDVELLLTAIIKDNPRIQRIEAEKNYPGTLVFSFYEYEILGTVQDSSTQEWALVNQRGLVVERNLKQPPAGLVRITFELPHTFEEEDVLFTEEEIDFMVHMMMLFHKNTGFAITDIIANPVSREYTLKNTKGWSILVDAEYSPELIITNLNTVISQVDLGENYKLIDLRIPNKAFICYKEQGCQRNTVIDVQ